MKIAYICTWEITSNDGVTKKIGDQVRSWENLGHEVNVFCCCREIGESLLKATCYIKPAVKDPIRFFTGPGDLIKDIESFNPEIVYLRHELYKPYLLRILRRYRTVVEINTDDVIELKLLSKTSKIFFLRNIYHIFTRSILFNNAKVFVTVTKELSEREVFKKYKKPIVVIPNTIVLNGNYNRTLNEEKVNIIFIGSLTQPWQGVDKVERLAEILGDNYIFHIIGDSGNKRNTSNMIFHGYLQQHEYEKVIKVCNIGIGTLAVHRKGLEEACALKVREYIAYGLPVILGYKDTAFLDKVPDWVLEIPNTEDCIEKTDTIKKIIAFIDKMKKYSVKNEECSKYIDANELEKRKIDEISRYLYL